MIAIKLREHQDLQKDVAEKHLKLRVVKSVMRYRKNSEKQVIIGLPNIPGPGIGPTVFGSTPNEVSCTILSRVPH